MSTRNVHVSATRRVYAYLRHSKLVSFCPLVCRPVILMATASRFGMCTKWLTARSHSWGPKEANFATYSLDVRPKKRKRC